jgi:predicted GIY-YIG superfamily endonuclease
LMDVKVEQGPGPQGLHFGDGDSCFKVFTQTQNVPDCHFRPAESCIPAPPGPGGPDKPTDRERECLPQGRTGPYKVYVGLDKESGELTYVGITMQDLRVRERKHNSGQGIKRNIELVGVGLGYSEELAGAIERYLWERLKDEGYRLTNSPMRPQPWDPCYGYLMQAAGEVVERERLLEKAHSARRRPSK